MPAALQPVLERISREERFTVKELASQLDEPSRLVLVRRLVREGLLEVVEL
jgi:lysine-specific demethylase/histidyl-hydroxylase NO66